MGALLAQDNTIGVEKNSEGGLGFAKEAASGAGTGATVGTFVPIPGGTVIGAGVGAVVGTLASLLGNNRGDKRAARDELLEALYQAGVSRSALTKVHSDHVADLHHLAQWIERTGPVAIQYINDTLPAGTGPDWDDKIIAGYSRWKSQAQTLPATVPQNQSANLPAATAVPVQAGLANQQQAGMQLLKIGGTFLVVTGAGYVIYQLIQQ